MKLQHNRARFWLPAALLVALALFGLAREAVANEASPQTWGARGVAPEPRSSNALERTGAWPFGPAQAVAVDEGRALTFLSSGGAVLLLDTSDPGQPQRLSQAIQTQGVVADLAYDAATQRLYVAAGEGGLEIWDVADPALPSLLSRVEVLYFGVETPVNDVGVAGNFAYVGASWGYVHWLDVSDPANPIDNGFNGVGGNPTIGLFVGDGAVYACGPRFQQFLINGDGSLQSAGYRDFIGLCGAIFVAGNVAYVGYGNDLYLLDLTAPYFSPWGVYGVGGVAELVVAGNIAYVANSDGLQTWDVADPANAFLLGSYETPGYGAGLAIAGSRAYLADSGAGLRLLDVEEPAQPRETGSYHTIGATFAAFVAGHFAYTAVPGDGLFIFDVADPAHPALTGQYDTPGSAYDVTVAGEVAFVADQEGGLQVLDVADPANPTFLGSYAPLQAWRVAVAGDLAVVVESIINQPYRLWTFDVADPANPAPLGSLLMPGLVWEVALAGDYALVAVGDAGLRVVDLADPANPVEVGFYNAPAVFDVAVDGNYAYLASADWNGGFITLDVSNPPQPLLVSRYNPTGWFHPFDVAVSGDFAYLGEPAGVPALLAFDISDRANPLELEQVVPAGGLLDIEASGPTVFLADGNAGLQIYRNPAAITAVVDYSLRWDTGAQEAGTWTLLPDGTVADAAGNQGTWSFQPERERLLLQFGPGQACQAQVVGRLVGADALRGRLSCQDGSHRTARWNGQMVAGGLPAAPVVANRPR